MATASTSASSRSRSVKPAIPKRPAAASVLAGSRPQMATSSASSEAASMLAWVSWAQ
jgi:hypothetical protein